MKEKSQTERPGRRARVWAAVAALAACAAGAWYWHSSTVLPSPGPDHLLVGSWGSEGGTNVFNADGTGRNYDGSRFQWATRGGKLFSRTIAADGKSGDWFIVPYAVSRDGNEYRIALEGGRRKVAFQKVGPDGKQVGGRTLEGRAFDDASFEGALRVDPAGSPSPAPEGKKAASPPGKRRGAAAHPAGLPARVDRNTTARAGPIAFGPRATAG